MSLRPKKPVWTKKNSSGLPQYYKDKLPANNYSKYGVSAPLWAQKRVKIAVKVLTGLIVAYIVISWATSPSNDSQVKPIKKKQPVVAASGDELWNSRRDEVKGAFMASWSDYSKNAWGYDVYAPITGKGKNIKNSGPLGWIIVDSLDTLILMDLKEELEDAKSWVNHELTYDLDNSVHTFETTIRMLGGLLSAYYLTEDEVYSEKAVHLGNKLLPAFDTSNGLPGSEVNLKTGKKSFDAGGISTAEIATLQLEFKYLATITGEQMYWDAVDNIMKVLDRANNSPVVNKYDGLVPILMNPNDGMFNTDVIRLGSRGDSYYEYLLKQYLQTGEEIYLTMYNNSFNGIKQHLTGRSKPNNYLYFGELDRGLDGPLSNKMDHLVCFFGGLFALGATNGLSLEEAKKMPWWDKYHQEQLKYGEELGKTCYHMYHDIPSTGLSPEIVHFNTNDELKKYSPPDAYWSEEGDFFVKKTDAHNLQRPETVETLYYLYKITGDLKYREWGWEIFQNFVTQSGIGGPDQLGGFKGPLRFTTISDVFKTNNKGKFSDNLESFWLAETLKYLYLLFSDEDVAGGEKWKKWNLNNIVFNTEAHPLPRLDGVAFKSNWRSLVNDDMKKKVVDEPEVAVDSDELVDFDFSEDNEVVSEKIENLAEEDKFDQAAIEKNKQVAEKMIANGEKPVAKGKISKPLNEQVEDITHGDEDVIDSIDDIDPALEAELF